MIILINTSTRQIRINSESALKHVAAMIEKWPLYTITVDAGIKWEGANNLPINNNQ